MKELRSTNGLSKPQKPKMEPIIEESNEIKRVRQRWRPNITLNLNREGENESKKISKASLEAASSSFSGLSGSGDEQERKRKEMSWAEQVDLAYPLEEYWCDSCLRHPHDYTDDHHIPEEKSAKGEKEEKKLTRNMETWASEASDDEQERKRKEMSWAEQVDLAYTLEEYWCDSCLRHPHDYTDGHQIPEMKSLKGEEEEKVSMDDAQVHWNTFDFKWLDSRPPGWLHKAQEDMSASEQIHIISSLMDIGCNASPSLFTRFIDNRDTLGSYQYAYAPVLPVF